MAERYKNREIDRMIKSAEEAITVKLDNHIEQSRIGHETLSEKIRNGFNGVYERQEKLEANQKFTNGKIKKIIIALVAVGAFALGAGGENILTLFKFLL